MMAQLLRWLPFGFISLQAFLGLLAAVYYFMRPQEIVQAPLQINERALPVSSFQQGKEAYDYTQRAILSLVHTPPRLKIPDLKPFIVFQGKNARPDAEPSTQKMHFSFQGSKEAFSIAPGEKAFLVYDRKLHSNKYRLAQPNEEAYLWISARADGNDAGVHVSMLDQDGHEIVDDERSLFTLTSKESFRAPGSWELGKWRVDATLLARQKARWIGQDKFFERYGGDEFSEQALKQRVDFVDGENSYAIYAQPGDCFVWQDERWIAVQPDRSTQTSPLLVVKKVDERVMMLELWDVEGRAKMGINLIKANESFAAKPLTEEFRFIGARTKTKVLFEIQKDRMILKPNDWLILTEAGWKKLSTLDEIDSYVERKLVGPLFIFEGLAREDEKQVLKGSLVAPNRAEIHDIEIAIASPSMRKEPEPSPAIEAREENELPVATQN
ncbi:MAG: hypothetical protein ACK5MA_09865 [Parachlamydiaceae bacterium]